MKKKWPLGPRRHENDVEVSPEVTGQRALVLAKNRHICLTNRFYGVGYKNKKKAKKSITSAKIINFLLNGGKILLDSRSCRNESQHTHLWATN